MAAVSASSRAGSLWLLLAVAAVPFSGCSYLRPPRPPLDRPAGIHDSPDSRYPANEYDNDSGRIVGQRASDEPDGTSQPLLDRRVDGLARIQVYPQIRFATKAPVEPQAFLPGGRPV